MSAQVIDKVVEQLKSLPYDLQRQVLEFTRGLALSVPRGVPGKQLLLFAGAIPFEVFFYLGGTKSQVESVPVTDFQTKP